MINNKTLDKYSDILNFIEKNYRKLIISGLTEEDKKQIIKEVNNFYIKSEKIIDLPLEIFVFHLEILSLDNKFKESYKLMKYLYEEKVIAKSTFISDIINSKHIGNPFSYVNLQERIILLSKYIKLLFILEKDDEVMENIKLYSIIINKYKEIPNLVNKDKTITELFNSNTLLLKYMYDVLNIIKKKKNKKEQIKKIFVNYINLALGHNLEYIEPNIIYSFVVFMARICFKNKEEQDIFFLNNFKQDKLELLSILNSLFTYED